MNTHHTDVCIVGGGPAGMLLGLLLAAQGIDVTVLERNPDFQREYRGEILQPRFVQMIDQLGLREHIESYPHLRMCEGGLFHRGRRIVPIDFTQVIAEYPYCLWMPQPLLLQALLDKAAQYPSFHIRFHAPVKDLLRDDEQITGVIAQMPEGDVEFHAKVTVGADGRYSRVRKLGGFELEYEHYENDIAWFTAPAPQGLPNMLQLVLTGGRMCVVLPKYPDSIQGGITMKAGDWKRLQARGIEAMKEELNEASPAFREFVDELQDFKRFTLLQAKIHFVRDWAKDGCLLVGDSAHCASPVGGIGVALSAATAVVAADVIYDALQADDVSAARLARVQQLREQELRAIHAIQIRIEKVQMSEHPAVVRLRPHLMRLASHLPFFQNIQKKVLMAAQPLPIDPRFTFHN